MIRKPTTTSGASGAASRSVSRPMSATLNWRSPSVNAIELVARGAEAGAQRRPVAEVDRVVDGPDDVRDGALGELRPRWSRVASREPSSTAMISNVSARRRQGPERLLHEALEVGLLVVGREEVRQARDARSRAGPPAGVVRRASGAGVLGHEPVSRSAQDAGQRARVSSVDELQLVAAASRAISSESSRIT